MEKVSAIITTHNRAELLERAISSVIGQTYKELECIVVDDASTDNTKDICSKYPVQYIYIKKEESRGGNYARNLGIKASKGKYCAFLDDDDYWFPTKIEKQVMLMRKMDCELVHCGRRMEIINDKCIEYEDLLPRDYFSGDMRKKILMSICTTTSCILVLRQALLEIGMFDESLRFWQEYEMTIRLAQRKPFYFVNEALVVYRVDTHDKGRLTNKFDAWKNSVIYIYEKHNSLFSKLSWLEREKVKINYYLDAIGRAKNSGEKNTAFYYSILLYTRFFFSRLFIKVLGI